MRWKPKTKRNIIVVLWLCLSISWRCQGNHLKSDRELHAPRCFEQENKLRCVNSFPTDQHQPDFNVCMILAHMWCTKWHRPGFKHDEVRSCASWGRRTQENHILTNISCMFPRQCVHTAASRSHYESGVVSSWRLNSVCSDLFTWSH